MSHDNPIEVFKKEAPQVADAFDGVIQALVDTDGLDAKTKELVYIAVKASHGDDLAIKYHVPMAKKLGASRAEVRDAILITLATSGISGMAKCLPVALDLYDNG